MSDNTEEQQAEEQQTETEQEQATASQPEQELPGKRLRQAREKAGLSVAEVAKQMRLQQRMVTALEEDDYDALPSATFVSGYLRSYARTLGLPEDDFVTPVSTTIEPPDLVTAIGGGAQPSSGDLPVRLVTYLLLVAVIISIGMWWFAQRDALTNVDPESELIGPGDDVSLSLSEGEPAPTESVLADNAGVDAEVSGAAADEVEGTAVEAGESAEDTDAAAEAASEAAPESTAVATSTLELRYEADSWTEVYDSADQELRYGLVKAGEVLTLTGEAPFRIFLGYAPGVTVYYNGEPFDHSPFQRRDVARFRVGRAEHNLPGSR